MLSNYSIDMKYYRYGLVKIILVVLVVKLKNFNVFI